MGLEAVAQVKILPLLPTSCVNLSKALYLSLFIWKMGDRTYLIGLNHPGVPGT